MILRFMFIRHDKLDGDPNPTLRCHSFVLGPRHMQHLQMALNNKLRFKKQLLCICPREKDPKSPFFLALLQSDLSLATFWKIENRSEDDLRVRSISRIIINVPKSSWRALSLLTVICGCLQDEGLRDWRCLIRMWNARTVIFAWSWVGTSHWLFPVIVL